MSAVLQVTRSSTPINVDPDESLVLRVVSGDRLYYGDTPFVNAARSIGFIDAGGSHTFTDDEFWAISAGTTYLTLDYSPRNIPGVGGATAIYKNVIDYGADPTGVIDSTTSFNLALAAGSTFIPDGNYKILGTVTVPLTSDLRGSGRGAAILKLGAAGRMVHGDRGTDSTVLGGYTGGFTLDGQTIAQPSSSMFYVGFCNKRKFDLTIRRGAGDNVVIETAQNCTWDTCHIADAGRSNVVLDYGAGGHVFYNLEASNPGRHGVEFRQTGQSLGGYPTFLGPSGNSFIGGIAEYGDPTATHASIHHAAGTNNQFTNFSASPTSRTATGAAAIRMDIGANAISTTCTVTSGSANVTVANATGISPLMSARIPGFPAGSIVANVVGNVVTMFAPATSSSAAGTACTFGAQSGSLQFDGLTCPGTDSKTYGIDLLGAVTMTLSGRTVFTNHIAAVRAFGNSSLTLSGPVSYFSCPLRFTTNGADDSGIAALQQNVVRGKHEAGLDITSSSSSSDAALTLKRDGQTHAHTAMYPGLILLSDGLTDPSDTGIQWYTDPDDGLRYLMALPYLQAAFTKTIGLGGATVNTRFMGRYQAPSAPTAGTWKVGDYVIDQDGVIWLCTVAGTPGTWSAGRRPTYTALSYPANAASLALGDAAGSSIDRDHRVTLRGAITFTASFAAGATLGTITAAHRTPSAVQVFHGAKYDSGGVITYAPLLVASSGAISSKVAFVSGDSFFLDGVNYHAA